MSLTDREIIERVINGDRRAYARLVDRHKDKAMTLAMRMLKDREEAEEAVQDAFLRAFNALGRFEWKSSFGTWFYRIVYNVCSTALSRRGTDLTISLQGEEDDSTMDLRDSDPTPEMSLESEEMARIIRQEIDLLPASYSSVVTLFFLQELSYAEIVEITGMPLGTVKARLFRARTILKKAILRRTNEKALLTSTRGIAAAFL
ncbi:MAG: sigma-70 family RNA polymerase sigma factor [Bacteroidota bacterium]